MIFQNHDGMAEYLQDQQPGRSHGDAEVVAACRLPPPRIRWRNWPRETSAALSAGGRQHGRLKVPESC